MGKHHQGPSAIDAEVNKNHLSQKNYDLCGLNHLKDPWRVLEGPASGRDHQGSTLRGKKPFKPPKNLNSAAFATSKTPGGS